MTWNDRLFAIACVAGWLAGCWAFLWAITRRP